MGVALRSHEGGFEVPTAWLATRFGVALMSHEGGFARPFFILPSAFPVWWPWVASFEWRMKNAECRMQNPGQTRALGRRFLAFLHSSFCLLHSRSGLLLVWYWSGGVLTWILQESYIVRLTTLAIWLWAALPRHSSFCLLHSRHSPAPVQRGSHVVCLSFCG